MAEEIKCPHCNKSIEDIVNDEKTKQSNLKDLYKRYCECRDQEIERFWKNSVYLWTFLAICFTGYGFLLNSYLGKDVSQKLEAFFPLVSLFICCFAMILSYLWLRMAKALKTTFESFEMATWEFECFDNIFDCDNKYLIHNYWTAADNDRPSSPTKIAVVLGNISIIFWGAVLFMSFYIGYEPTIKNIVTNIYSMLYCNDEGLKHYNCITYLDILRYATTYSIVIIVFICVTIFFCVFFFSKILKCCIKSDRMRTKDENDIFNSIREVIRKDLYVDKKSEIPYFEIKKDEVCFIFKNMEQYLYGEKTLIPYYNKAYIKDDEDKDKKQLKIRFDYGLIQKYYKEPHYESKKEEKQLEEQIKEKSKINVKVRIYESIVCVSFDGYDYKKDMDLITETLNDLMKTTEQYANYHITYKLKKNNDENANKNN